MLIRFSELDEVLQDFDESDWSKFIELKENEVIEKVKPYAINIENKELVIICDCEIFNYKKFEIRLDLISISVKKIKEYLNKI